MTGPSTKLLCLSSVMMNLSLGSRTVTFVAVNIRSNRPTMAVSPPSPAFTSPSESTWAKRSLLTPNTPMRVTSRVVPSLYSAINWSRCSCPGRKVSLSGINFTPTTWAGAVASSSAPCRIHRTRMSLARLPRRNRVPPSWGTSPRPFPTSRLSSGDKKFTLRRARSCVMAR